MSTPPEPDELAACRRNVYRLQVTGNRLCDALRLIAGGCDNPAKVARAALNAKLDAALDRKE